MGAQTFGRQWLGFRREVVLRELAAYEQEMADLRAKLAEAEQRWQRAEAEREELSLTLAAMRRQQLQPLSSGSASMQPAIVLVGPTDVLGPITLVVDALESSPHFTPRFRVFRDGFYRVDGETADRTKLIDWLRALPEVRETRQDQETIHVVPGTRGTGERSG
ncbi:MAG: hypothetical protein OWS03_09560 [Alicyclobacillaceae bacterium]|nr:hypothetical protein [Alicyclobacillaceae bacterium]